MNCVSVGVTDYIADPKSLTDTFLRKIGAEGGQSRSLYKIPWLLVGVNFLDMTDE